MLNLSDKELDRLAREAANEYDPGNQAGPGAWDRLQLRMDKELGNYRPNFFRSIRRMPFYYAPAILLLVGATYYLARPSRGHSRAVPVAAAAPPSSPTAPNSVPLDASSTTAASSTAPVAATASAPTAPASATSASPAPGATAKTENSGSPPPAGTATVRPLQATGDNSIHNQKNTYRSTSTPHKENSSRNNDKTLNPAFVPGTENTTRTAPVPNAGNTAPEGHDQNLADPTTSHGRNHQHNNNHNIISPDKTSPTDKMASSNKTGSPHKTSSTDKGRTDLQTAGNQDRVDNAIANSPGSVAAGSAASSNTGAAGTNTGTNTSAYNAASPGLSLSTIRGPQSSRLPEPVIDDARLRKLGARTELAKAATPVNPGKKPSPSAHIDRPLQLGFSLAPDFTSVNSLAGDKPGSSIGITADYQLLNRLHIHTGFLLSHKNYTAAEEDYHVPYNYYRMNNMHYVSFVKGSLNLWEIPLTLRYDFSVTGNTVFFVSGGASSYLLTHENCNYYFDLFGRTAREEFKYGAHNLSLFSTVDLSMGVETGLSNSLSFLVAPYMKLPTTGLGFGKIEMNSVGIEFALKYTPVLKRKRH